MGYMIYGDLIRINSKPYSIQASNKDLTCTSQHSRLQAVNLQPGAIELKALQVYGSRVPGFRVTGFEGLGF